MFGSLSCNNSATCDSKKEGEDGDLAVELGGVGSCHQNW